MTLTLERPLIIERPWPGSPAPSHATAPPAATPPTPPRNRRPRMRWMALAVLLVAGLLIALIVSADSAKYGRDATTVELEPIDKADAKPSTPTSVSPSGADSAPTWWPFGERDDAEPACGRVPWLLPCPDKATAP